MRDSLILNRIKQVYPDFFDVEIGLILSMNHLVLDIFRKDERNDDREVIVFFDLINSFNNDDQETFDIIVVGFLELLTDTFELQKLAFGNLKAGMLEKFDKLFDTRFWRLSE